VENQVQKKENTHAFLGRFDVEHMPQHLFKLLYGNQKKQSRMIVNKSPALKLLLKMERENLLCIFHYDTWSHLDFG
jgi:hypothetical protein